MFNYDSKTNSPVLFNAEEIYKIFFCDGKCVVDLDFPMILLYFLDSIARDGDKIILINVNQENTLFDEGFVCNGTNSICLDNLNHVQKYVKEVEGQDVTATTNLDSFVDENCKFSNFLADLIVKLLSIEQISHQKISEILELFLRVKIPRQRVYDLFNKAIDGYLSMSIQELQEKIIDCEIEFSGFVHYDEEFLWIKHQPYVRLTLLDAENKLIIKYTVVPREIFTKNYIKLFLETSLQNLDVKTIITDGYRAYASIIDDLGFSHQRCTFHGKMVPFTYKVKNGDIVEIQTTKEITTGPKRDWLKMVKTGEAKNKIRSWFKNERREENIVNGREELFREFKRNGIRLPENAEEEFLNELARKAHAESVEDFYAAIGYGGIVLSRIMQRVKDDYNRMMKANALPTEGDIIEKKDDRPHSNDGVYIEGIDNCMVKMSKCCNPLPGDEIIGYITRGFGVSIHKRSCVNVPLDITSHDEPHRWVKARWSDKITDQSFKAALRIYCNDRDGILADVTSQLSNMHVGISFLNSRNTKDGHGIISVTISVSGREHLDTIIAKLSRINDIISIERAAD